MAFASDTTNYVLEVYRITLLSNDDMRLKAADKVLEVYRITLLSNFGSTSSANI